MAEFIETFHIDWKLMLAQILNFALVFLVFYLLAAKPLRKLMHDRGEEIKTGITNAQKNSELLKKTKEEYENVLIEARKEAERIFEEGKKEAQKKKDTMLEEAKTEVDNMIQSGKIALEADKIKMVESAKNELATLALLAARKIMESGDKHK